MNLMLFLSVYRGARRRIEQVWRATGDKRIGRFMQRATAA